ncbi:hypothetical protein V2J09_013662 [Rumex salicifolius]
MEESGALRPIPLASRPPPHDGKLSRTREEGEVTSDEDALPACSSAPSVSASDSVFPSNSTSNFGGKSSIQGVKSGKSNFANQSGSADIQSRTSLQIGTLKGFAKHQGPLKLSNPQWHKPLGESSNLVISFSDDESGSDSEQQETRKACETDSRTQALPVVTRSKKPSSSPLIMDTITKTTSNEQKVLPKKVTMSHTIAPSIPRSNIPKPKNMWPSVVEHKSRSTNSNFVSRNLAIRGSGRSKSVDLSDNKLQDLRQQIALRENELKLKTLQQKRENISEACRDLNNINQSNSAPRRPREILSDVHIEVKEPDAKRKKLSQDGSGHLSRVFNEKTSAKKLLSSKELATKCNNLQDVGLVDRGHRDGHSAQTELLQGPIRMQMPDEHPPSLSVSSKATGQDAPCFSASCSLSDWVSKSRSNLVVSNPIPSVADMPMLNLPKTSGAVSVTANQSGRVNGTDPSSSGKQTTPVDDTTKCHNQLDVQAKADKLKYDSNLPVHSIQASPNDPSTSDQHHEVTLQEFGDTDIHSIFAIEEFHDKQLEKAQEHRHRCEIEERNALKAYHKARRALAEANAQCTNLYRKRELFSARISSFLVDNPGVILPSQQQEHFGDLWNFPNNVSEVNLDLIPSATDQVQAELDAGNQAGYESNVQSAEGDVHHRFSPNVDGNNLGSAACSEPDVSTSELLPHNNKETANGVLSPSNDLNVSSDECEEMYALQGKKDNIGESNTLPIDRSRESVLLEEYLRSKLFSRLEAITLRRNGVGGKRDERLEHLSKADTRSDTQMTSDNIPSPQPEKEQYREYGSASGDQQEVSAVEHSKDDEGSAKVQLRMDDVLHSDVTETQNPDLGGFDVVEPNFSTHQEADEHCLFNSANRSYRGADHEYRRPQSTDVNQCVLLSSILKSAFVHIKGSYSASYNDVCIFTEQDGVCHPYENKRVDCTEESVKDSLVGVIDSYSCNYLIDPLWPLCMYELRGRCNNEECPWQHVRDYTKSNLQHKSPSSVDSVTGSSSNCSNLKVGRALSPPAYLVSVDSLIADSHKNSYIAERKCGPFWQKIFSTSLVVPSFLHRHGCTEIRGIPDGQSLYFQSRNDTTTLLQTDLPDKNQVLETALLILNQETEKALGIRKALSLLSRGLEADPTSLHLWVVYLLIYYSDRESVGDDELFSCACLGESDKCIFWISSAYIVIYKKLPDGIVGRFELEKDAPLMDWPSVHKTSEEKQLVYKLMEMAADSMESQNSVCPEKNTALRAAELLSLNHVKLVAAIDNFESCIGILEKYSNQYSSCLELVLLAARVCRQKCEGNNIFLGFEEALSKWPKELPGIQCIWNQFAEYALQNGGSLVGKEIMLRWYDSVSKAQSSQIRAANKDDYGENNKDYVELFDYDYSESKLGCMDATFGLLNLSLHELLQKDVEKAYFAADKAMKTAHQDLRHCLKEHSMFLLNYGSQVDKDVSLAGLLDLLKSYISHTNNSPVSEPLTHKFIQQIPKPRLRQLVHGLFSPISPDFSTVNLVLETWFGPSLLPQQISKMKELVDFVEAILELSPCNYPFAITTCKLLLRKEIDSASNSFWASSLMINTIYESVPVPPEYVWVEAAGLLTQMRGIEAPVAESFHQRALSVYPFSINLWNSFLLQSANDNSRQSILEAAKEKGIEFSLAALEEKGLVATKERGINVH